MDDLTYSLRLLCRNRRNGSPVTQAERLRVLMLASCQLREAGFRQMRARSLKDKHVQVLLKLWQAEAVPTRELENRVTHLRWWAAKTGNAELIPADGSGNASMQADRHA